MVRKSASAVGHVAYASKEHSGNRESAPYIKGVLNLPSANTSRATLAFHIDTGAFRTTIATYGRRLITDWDYFNSYRGLVRNYTALPPPPTSDRRSAGPAHTSSVTRGCYFYAAGGRHYDQGRRGGSMPHRTFRQYWDGMSSTTGRWSTTSANHQLNLHRHTLRQRPVHRPLQCIFVY